MILVCGIPSEPPMALLLRELQTLNAPYAVFNQRRFESYDLEYQITAGRVGGRLRLETGTLALGDVQAVYTRLMDDARLPELAAEPSDTPRRLRCRELHAALTEWYEIAPARVVNRSRPMASNFSKSYQAQIILQHGFSIPETLITNDPELALEFRALHGRVIYKSISSVRSIVSELCDLDLDRLDAIRWCPVQFQAFVEGLDVRVHTIGPAVFATAISCDATDYRYATRTSGVDPHLEPIELPDELAQRCLMLAATLGLPMAGIDLRITADSEVFCFEVNPSPAYSYYESHTGQPLARTLACYLAGRI